MESRISRAPSQTCHNIQPHHIFPASCPSTSSPNSSLPGGTTTNGNTCPSWATPHDRPRPHPARRAQHQRKNRRTLRPRRHHHPARTHPAPAVALRRPLAPHPYCCPTRRRNRANLRRNHPRRPHPAPAAHPHRHRARRSGRHVQTALLQLLPQPAKSLCPRAARPLLR